MMTAQDLLTLATESFFFGAIALYFYLFVIGLVQRYRQPQIASVAPAAALAAPVVATCEVDEVPTAEVDEVPTAEVDEVPTAEVDEVPTPAVETLLPLVEVAPADETIAADVAVLAEGNEVTALVVEALPQPVEAVEPPLAVPALDVPDFAAMTSEELIQRAKQSKFPAAKKWSRSRKLGAGERDRAIAFLSTAATV